MASRFFVASDSDYEEEEDKVMKEEEEKQEKEEEVVEEEKDTKPKSRVASFFDTQWKNTNEKRVVRSEKSKRWEELNIKLNQILDELVASNFKKSFEYYQELTKLHAKAKKAIEEHGYPNFFIRLMSEIQQQIKDLLPDNKDLRRFSQELEKFVVPFSDKLKECAENPENFLDPEEEEDDMDFNNDDDEDVDDDDEDEGPSRWFIKSSDDEDNKDENKDKKKEKKVSVKSEVDYSELIEQRLLAAKNEVITNDTAREELTKASQSRTKGKIITTTERLSVLLHRVDDEQLKNDIQMEICFTVMQGPADESISLDDWRLVLNILPKFRKPEEAEALTPLFERLARDFWAKSVDPRATFTPEMATLHKMQSEFLTALIRFADILEAARRWQYCIRLQIVLLEQNYHELAPSAKERAARRAAMSAAEAAAEETNQREGIRARTPRELFRSILVKLGKDDTMFDALTTLSIKVKSALFYAIHLAYNGHPLEAQQLVSVLPEVPPELPFVRVLNNRAYAEIGIAAFMCGHYRICYTSLRGLIRAASGYLGQHPRMYAPWLQLDPGALEAYHWLSVMLLEIPALTMFSYDDQSLPVAPKLHKDLQKKIGIAVCPESIVDKICVAIERCKRGEWQLARDTLKYEIERYIPDPRLFERDLKRLSLCSYLLTAHQFYDAVEISTLKKHFGLEFEDEKDKDQQPIPSRDVEDVLQCMHNGRAPVINCPIIFNAEYDRDYVRFRSDEQETVLSDYGRTLGLKRNSLAAEIKQLEPDDF